MATFKNTAIVNWTAPLFSNTSLSSTVSKLHLLCYMCVIPLNIAIHKSLSSRLQTILKYLCYLSVEQAKLLELYLILQLYPFYISPKKGLLCSKIESYIICFEFKLHFVYIVKQFKIPTTKTVFPFCEK